MRVRENIGVLLATLVLGISLSANVVLARKLREVEPAPLAGFSAGRQFPLLTGETSEGTPYTIDFSTPTIAYVFSPNCGWCKADQPNLDTLRKHAGGRYRFVGISVKNSSAPAKYVQAMREYLDLHPFPGPVILLDPDRLDPQTARQIRLTPQTVAIDASGSIERSWPGALIGERQRDAERFFGLLLPGVAMERE